MLSWMDTAARFDTPAMSITLIAAIARGNVIGYQNQLAWHLPADLKHFKQYTLGKTLLMGRKTFESLGRKPLPGRQTVILTSDPHYAAEHCQVITTLSTFLNSWDANQELIIAGGEKVYRELLPLADKMVLSFVNYECVGDTYFPAWDKKSWQENSRIDHPIDEKNQYSFSIVTYKRKRP